MRNVNWKSLLFLGAIASLSLAVVLVQRFDIPGVGGRGSDDFLGLQLGLDLAGGSHLIYEAGTEVEPPQDEDMEELLRIIRRRVDRLGATEPSIQQLGDNRIVVQLPGVQEVERAKRLIGQTASLEFMERVCQDILCTQFEDRETGLKGEDLARVFADQDTVTGEHILRFEMQRDATREFARFTQRIYDTNASDSPDQLAILLDGELQVSAGVRSPILTGSGQISGTYTADRARDLAISLESGRLPIDIRVVTERVVDASLGEKSLQDSLVAGAIGLALVLFFMGAYYQGVGVVAALALAFYTAIVLAVFKMVPVTLNLASVAAFILSMGMAVDANILVFERMKEEFRAGRTLASAIQIGFNRAWPSIRDGNISTFIISGILYWFGTQFAATAVTGFALALFIGVATSMFTAFFISRRLLTFMAATPLRRFPSLFTPEPLRKKTASDGGRPPQPRAEGGS